MTQFVRMLARSLNDPVLTPEERNLLESSYKAAVDNRMVFWRRLGGDGYLASEAATSYRKHIASEVHYLCMEVLTFLDERLLPAVSHKHDEGGVACLAMSGDFYARLAELEGESAQAQAASGRYEHALDVATQALPPTDPLRLSVALHWCILLDERLDDRVKAMELAKHTFDEAAQKLDRLDEASHQRSAPIIQSLRDKLTAWSAASA